ncbi:zinc ribbon domain-containing protein [Salinicola peritrichatus]|uniref:zinc ribbon domain-containing protein n=1 Tax=Salinicola peritrichatus TaxID=1267424 RepID=UPI000DA1F00B|nr:zinc ribbon domain-containing protein [Salinicola peritrichatus]
MTDTVTRCPQCGSESLQIPPGDAPDQEVRCGACGAIVGKKAEFTSDMQKREEKYVKNEVADSVEKGLPGDEAPGTER